jgi:hypothetical protein
MSPAKKSAAVAAAPTVSKASQAQLIPAAVAVGPQPATAPTTSSAAIAAILTQPVQQAIRRAATVIPNKEVHMGPKYFAG